MSQMFALVTGLRKDFDGALASTCSPHYGAGSTPEDQSVTLAAATTQRDGGLSTGPTIQLMGRSDDQTRPRRTDRMAERDTIPPPWMLVRSSG